MSLTDGALIGANISNTRSNDHDYYATEPIAVEKLIAVETFRPQIWECCSGENHIVNVLRNAGYTVRASDIVQRTPETELFDFLTAPLFSKWQGDIITNPPFSHAEQIIRAALDVLPDNHRAAFLLPIRYVEGQQRAKLFADFPPQKLYVFSKRITCAKNGDFKAQAHGAVAYAWFIFKKAFAGETTLHWL